VLGTTAVASYGALLYAFPVFVVPMQGSLGWSATQVTAGMSLAQLVAGAAAIPIGRWVDRHGARALMPAGALLGTLLLAAWSRVTTTGQWFALMAAMGVAMAAVQYEPAFAVIATWFRRRRAHALTLLTFMGAFASMVGVPVASMLVRDGGWRAALVQLSVAYACVTIVPLLLVLRHHPGDLGLVPDGAHEARASRPERDWVGAGQPRHAAARSAIVSPGPARGDVPSARIVRQGAPYRLIAASFTLSAFVSMAVVVHLIPLLLQRGVAPGVAASAMAAIGVTAIPGRLLLAPLASRWSTHQLAAVLLATQAMAAACMLAGTGAASVWTFVTIFGAASGAITPTRASLLAELAPAEMFGQINGPIAFLLCVARAAGPVGGSFLVARAPGWGHGTLFLLAIVILSLAAAAAVLASRGRRAWPATIQQTALP